MGMYHTVTIVYGWKFEPNSEHQDLFPQDYLDYCGEDPDITYYYNEDENMCYFGLLIARIQEDDGPINQSISGALRDKIHEHPDLTTTYLKVASVIGEPELYIISTYE